MLEKLKKLWENIKLFFATTKLGHVIKSAFITFTGLFIGILFANPLINALFGLDLPTIQQLKDIWPVIVDSFYRSLWAFFLLEIGIYKYSSSSVEAQKSNIVPTK